MRSIVFLGGTIWDYNIVKKIVKNDDLLICADSGANHLRSLELIPHWLVGDFDSIAKDDLSFFKEREVLLQEFEVDKDYTDGEIAIKKAIDLGAKEIIIFGGTGGRIDHTFGNVFLLEKIFEIGISAKIIANNEEILITNSKLDLYGFKGCNISLFPLDKTVFEIFTKGLKFPLKGENLYRGDTRGLSNVFLNDHAQISVKNGTLLVIKSIE